MEEQNSINPTSSVAPENQHSPVQKTLSVYVSKMKYILLGLLVLVLLLALGGAYYLGVLKQSASQKNNNLATATVKPSATPTAGSQTRMAPLFTGTIKPVSDLGIFVESQVDIDNAKLGNETFSVDYFEAGIYSYGPHAGYKRIIAIVHTSSYQSGYFIGIFATKDNKNFIMNPIPYYSDNGNLVKSKIEKTETLESDHPDEINLDSHFVLHKIDFGTITDDKYNTSLLTNVSGFKKLSSSNPNLKYFARPADLSNLNPYIGGKTEVVVTDETGFAYFYNITTQDNLALYNQDKQKVTQQEKTQKEFNALWDAKYSELEKQGKGMANGYTYTTADEAKIVGRPYPSYPEYVTAPNLKINSSDIKNPSVHLYKQYDVSFPAGCGGTNYTSMLKNISDNEMLKIGTTNSFDLYVIADKNNPLYKAEFAAKIYENPAFKEVNHLNPPTYNQYMVSYPLIFAKDYWGRWFALGEYDYQLLGGCGKPVIYLYPQKNTEVRINFQDPVTLDLSIPLYNNGWNILAHPDGTLVDLQPQFTNCDLIDVRKVGSEYAKDACNRNQYPYIYWAGKNLTKNYPRIDNGWIVAKDELNNFMSVKLTEVGLTEKEKSDMMDYWLPQMIAKNAPYYRISFLTTLQMNELVPMNIIPKPDKLYRLFLDYLPLSEKPSIKINAPTLPKIERGGFTVVEWGGLKR